MNYSSSRINQKVIFISGAGHSGSTLLGFILGSHSDCFYCGEAKKTNFLGDEKKALRKRVCKICGINCPIWKDFVVDNTLDLYEQVARKVSKSVIIDSTKNIAWLEEKIEAIESTSTTPYLIFFAKRRSSSG